MIVKVRARMINLSRNLDLGKSGDVLVQMRSLMTEKVLVISLLEDSNLVRGVNH